jgi:hypothetical protein
MAKFHDEHRDPEHDDLVADIKKDIFEVAGLVYPEFGAKRYVEIETRRNGGKYDYVIAHVYDDQALLHLIIDARPKLSDFEAVAQWLETCQRAYYQERYQTTQSGKDPSKQVRQDILDKHSRKVIVTRSDPDSPTRISAERISIFLVVQDEATRRFSLPKDTA